MVWLKTYPLPQPRSSAPAAPTAPARTDHILEQLRALVVGGAYAPGRRLPSERSLAARLKVGRPALREAMRALNALGVLETRRGSGTYIRAAEARGALFDPLSLTHAKLSPGDQFEVRKLLEPRAAALAATRATETQLREIQTAHQALQEPDLDDARRVELDLALHFAVVRAAGNPLLVLLHQALHPLLKNHAGQALAPDRLREAHAAFIDSIAQRQPVNAARILLRHLEDFHS